MERREFITLVGRRGGVAGGGKGAEETDCGVSVYYCQQVPTIRIFKLASERSYRHWGIRVGLSAATYRSTPAGVAPIPPRFADRRRI